MKRFLYFFIKRLASKKCFSATSALLFLTLKKIWKVHFVATNIIKKDTEMIDVVIPTATKDLDTLKKVILSLSYVCHPIQHRYIIGPDNQDLRACAKEQGCIFIEESTILGYNKKHISYQYKGEDRSGWIFQQLLKLGAEKIVKNNNYLVIDADTLLIKPHIFKTPTQTYLFETDEWNEPYVYAYEKLFSSPYPSGKSFVSHMMLFNKDHLKEMKEEIEHIHHTSWDKAFINAIQKDSLSGISEYEIYGHWLASKHKDAVYIVPLYNKSIQGDIYPTNVMSVSYHTYDHHQPQGRSR